MTAGFQKAMQMRGPYGVCVRFRHRKLNLVRGIGSLAEAFNAADRLREHRFHDRDAIFVICERTGEQQEDPRRASDDHVPRPHRLDHEAPAAVRSARVVVRQLRALHRGLARLVPPAAPPTDELQELLATLGRVLHAMDGRLNELEQTDGWLDHAAPLSKRG